MKQAIYWLLISIVLNSSWAFAADVDSRFSGWRFACWGVARAILTDIRFIGYSDGRRAYEGRGAHKSLKFLWDEPNFKTVVESSGLLAPAVQYHLAKDPSNQYEEILESLSYVLGAPREIKTALFFLHRDYPDEFLSPFVATSAYPGLAVKYGPRPSKHNKEALENSDLAVGNSVFFAVRRGRDYESVLTVGSAKNNRRDLEIVAEAFSKEVNPYVEGYQQERYVAVRTWLEEHRWLEDFVVPTNKVRSEGLTKWVSFNLKVAAINVGPSREETGVIDAETAVSLRVPPEDIMEAVLFDEAGNVLREIRK